MSHDDFQYRSKSYDGPAAKLIPVAPSDDLDLTNGATRSVFVGEAGTLTVVDLFGNTVSLISSMSQYHPIRVRRILATGTTASGIVAIY